MNKCESKGTFISQQNAELDKAENVLKAEMPKELQNILVILEKHSFYLKKRFFYSKM